LLPLRSQGEYAKSAPCAGRLSKANLLFQWVR
jgi:hypothetical protein